MTPSLNFSQKTYKIEFDGGDITVRGLAFPDLAILVETHRETVSSLFDRFTGRDPNKITTDDMADLGMTLVTTVPAVVAHVIALAANVGDRYNEVLYLPIDVQVAALEKVAEMTFSMPGGTKGFLEAIVRLAGRTNEVVVEVNKAKSQT